MNQRDALAGVTTAAVVIPQSMAYATIAGLPVQVGLYTAIVPLLVYALLGSSRALSVSTTSTIAALTAVAVATVAPASGPGDRRRDHPGDADRRCCCSPAGLLQARLRRRLHLAARAGRDSRPAPAC